MERIHFNEVDSTFTYLKDNYQKLPDFYFVSADFQSNGIGRNERAWNANKNENLLFSYLIKRKELIDNFSLLSLFNGVIIAMFIESLGIKNVSIKWPNDVYINQSKVCGILLKGSLPNYLMVGIGLNVNQSVFNGEYRVLPTSLKLVTKRTYDIDKLSTILFNFIEEKLKEFNKDELLSYAKTHNFLKNENISYLYNKKELFGKVIDINLDGSLLIKNEGELISIKENEVCLLKKVK